jgi:hypothetical protein
MQKLKHLLSRCMSQSVVISAFLLLQNTCFAQIDFGEFQYEPGYLITAKGDTMRGLIKYTRQYELSHRVQFRNEKTREPETFRPFAVKAFFVKNEYYEAKIYDYAPYEAQGYAVFMRRVNLEDGPIRIYEYWNSDKERGFTQTFIEKQGKPMLEVDYLRFKKQMMRFFEDFPQLSAKIGRNAFKASELPRIAAEYNAWKVRGW